MAKTNSKTQTATTSTEQKPKTNLSESQRQGAIDRATEAFTTAARAVKAIDTPEVTAVVEASGDEGELNLLAVLVKSAYGEANTHRADAVMSGSVADAQHASRAAERAAQAAQWLAARLIRLTA